MRLDELLRLIGREAEREEFLRLSRQYYEASGARDANASAGAANADARRAELLDQVMQRIQWHFRAIRYPMPTPQEVDDMIRDYFK